jgi:hypothetical protein
VAFDLWGYGRGREHFSLGSGKAKGQESWRRMGPLLSVGNKDKEKERKKKADGKDNRRSHFWWQFVTWGSGSSMSKEIRG